MAKAKSGGSGKGADVLFRVGVAAMPEAKRSLKELGDQALRAQQQLDRSLASVSRTAEKASSAIAKGISQAIATAERQMASSVERMRKMATEASPLRQLEASMPSKSRAAVATTAATVASQTPAVSGSRLNASRDAQTQTSGRPVAGPGKTPDSPTITGLQDMLNDELARHRRHLETLATMRQNAIREMVAKENSLWKGTPAESPGSRGGTSKTSGGATPKQSPTERRAYGLDSSSAVREREERVERDTNLRQAADAAAKRRAAIEREHNSILSRDSEYKNQASARKDNTALAPMLRIQPGTDQERQFAAKSLAEQEKLIAAKLQKETELAKSITGLRGRDLQEYRGFIQGRIQALQQLAQATEAQSKTEYAANSRTVQAALRERQRTIAAQIRELTKFDGEMKRALQEEDRENDRLHSRHRARQLSTARANRAARDAEVKNQQAALNAMKSDYDRHVSTIRGANSALVEPLMNIGESVGRTVRGFAQLGLVGEENAQKLLEGWIKIQSAYDILAGSAKTVASVSKAIELWTTATTAQKSASEILAAMSKANAAAMVAETGAVNAQAGAYQRLAVSKAAASGAGAGKVGAVANVASAAIPSAPGAAGTAAAGAAPVVGGAATVFAAGVAAFVGAAAGMVSAASTIKEAAKYGFGGGAGKGTVADTIATQEASLVAKLSGSLGQRTTNALLGPLSLTGFFDPMHDLAASNSNMERMQKQRALEAEQRQLREQQKQRIEEQGTVRAQADRKRYDVETGYRRETSTMRLELAPRANPAERQLVSVRQEIAKAQRRLESLPEPSQALAHQMESRLSQLQRQSRKIEQGMVSPDLTRQRDSISREQRQAVSQIDRLRREREMVATKSEKDEKTQQILEVNQRLTELAKARSKVEMDILDAQKQGRQEAIAGAQRELDIALAKRKANLDSLKTAAERFGDMDPLEQRKLISLKQKSLTAGRDALSNQERADYENLDRMAQLDPTRVDEQGKKRLASYRDRMADASSQNLTRAERRALAEVGLGEDQDIASRAARRDAEKAGFSRYFGGRERQDSGLQKAIEQKLQAEIRQNYEVSVKLEDKRDDVARQVYNLLVPLLRGNRAEQLRAIEETAQRAIAESNSRVPTDRHQAAAMRT